jgi:hypothetical protein
MVFLGEGFEKDPEEPGVIRSGDVSRGSAGESDGEAFCGGGISDFRNEEGLSALLRCGKSVHYFGFRDPGGEGRILDSTLLCEGRAAHAALLKSGKDFSFVFRAIPGSTDAITLDDGGSRVVRRRCHSSTSYDIYARFG